MDIGKLLKLLNAHNVHYVIIGAAAFAVHGYSRATRDIDFFIEATPENVRRTITALREFGYDMSDISAEEMLTKKLLIRQYIVETDIHPFVAGARFESVWRNKVEDKLYNVPVAFASLNDLIRMKRAAGRQKDREDLKYLLDLRRIRREKSKS